MADIALVVYLGSQGPAGVGVTSGAWTALLADYVGHGTVDDHVVFKVAHQQAADTASLTGTSVHVDALSTTVVLPGVDADRWTVRAVGTLAMMHSAAGTGVMRVQINADNGSDMTTQNLSATVYGRWEASHILAAVHGGQTINVKVQYHSGTAGTTSGANPALDITAVRNT